MMYMYCMNCGKPKGTTQAEATSSRACSLSYACLKTKLVS